MLPKRSAGRLLVPLTAVMVLAAACTSNGADLTAGTTEASGVHPNANLQLPPPAPVVPVLRLPGGAAEVALGNVVALDGAVFSSEPVVRLELWAGSTMVTAADLEEPSTEVVEGLPWLPDRPGLQALALRAIDASGGVATSFPLWVRVLDLGLPDRLEDAVGAAAPAGLLGAPSRAPILGQVQAPAEDAPRLEVDTDCLRTVLVPPSDGNGVAVFAATFGSGGFSPVAVLPATGGVATVGPATAPMMVYTAVFDTKLTVPGPPAVVLPPNPCADNWSGELSIEQGWLTGVDDAERVYLYFSADGGESWERAPGTDQTFVSPNPDGQFYFGPYLPDDAGSLMFEAWGWTGNKVAPLGSGQWKGPVSPQTGQAGQVVAAVPGGGVLPGSDLDWKEIAPVKAGTLCLFGPVPGQIGLPESLCANWLSMQFYSREFIWKMAGQPSHGIVQVSIAPPPSGPALSFPGLVYTEAVPAPVNGVSTFDVPLEQVFDPVVKSAEYDPAPGYQMLVDLSTLAAATGDQSAQSGGKFFPLLSIAGLNDSFWVRVVPMDGAKPLPFVSNPIAIHVERAAPEGFVGTGTPEIVVEMTPPRLPNPAYERCVRVVGNPFGGKNPAPHESKQWNSEHATLIAKMSWYQFEMNLGPPFQPGQETLYHGFEGSAFVFENGVKKAGVGLIPGATVCAYTPAPPSKDVLDYVVDAIEFIAGAWDFVATMWDEVKSAVIDLVAAACGAVAGAHGVPESKAEGVCQGLASIAVSAVLVYFGVPPSLPNFTQLVENGKDEFAAWVVEEGLKLAKIDCSTLQQQCKDLAEDLLGSLLDEVQTQATAALAQEASTGGWILKIHPGIQTVAEPAGILSPAVFQISVTRPLGQPPLSSQCLFQGRAIGSKAFYSWTHADLGPQSGPVKGEVMQSKATVVDLSGVAPGETRVVTLLLPDLANWFPPGQGPQWSQLANYYKSQTLIFFEPNATIATELSTTCLGGNPVVVASQNHVPDGPSEPWKTPS